MSDARRDSVEALARRWLAGTKMVVWRGNYGAVHHEVARLLRAERRRAVRLVRKVKAVHANVYRQNPNHCEAVESFTVDLCAAILGRKARP